MRRWARRTVRLGLVAGLAYAIWRLVESRAGRREGAPAAWEPQPFPFPPMPAPPHEHLPEGVEAGGGPETEAAAVDDEGAHAGMERAWVEPVDGACPPSHPVKAKLASRIYHVEGGANYERTRPDRCYSSAAAAEADGFRPARH